MYKTPFSERWVSKYTQECFHSQVLFSSKNNGWLKYLSLRSKIKIFATHLSSSETYPMFFTSKAVDTIQFHKNWLEKENAFLINR